MNLKTWYNANQLVMNVPESTIQCHSKVINVLGTLVQCSSIKRDKSWSVGTGIFGQRNSMFQWS